MPQYTLGPLRFSLEGADPILPALLGEFEPLRSKGELRPGLEIRFARELPPIEGAILVPPTKMGVTSYEARHDGLAYQVQRLDDRVRVTVHSSGEGRRGWKPQWLVRFQDWNYLLWQEKIAKNFMYNVFDYLCQLALLDRGASYLHASSFEKDGRGVAVIAWGGVGKTTSMLKLVLEDGWRFLSDDLGLIDANGTLWRVPKKLQVYAYNLAGQPALAAAFRSGRGALDRLSWAWNLRKRGPKGVRRRLSAEEFLGAGSCGRCAKAWRAFFLERASGADFACVPMGRQELARRSAAILLEELKPFVTLASAAHSAGCSAALPSVSDLEARSAQVLEEAFGGTETFLVRVPEGAGPDELAGFIRKCLQESPPGRHAGPV